jgi:hypothetical protein
VFTSILLNFKHKCNSSYLIYIIHNNVCSLV